MLTEELVGLAPGELAAVWEAPLYGENMLHAVCEACTGGQSVELAAHYESFVCHEHHRWLGIYEGRPQNELRNFQYPGEPSGARLATDDVLRADIKYQALLSQGRISPTLLKECLSLVMGYPEEGTSLTPTPEAFPTLVNLLELLTDEELLKDLLNPGLTFAEARQLLEILLHRRGMKFSANVIDNIWIYLRPHFFATRTLLEDETSAFSPFPAVDLEHITRGVRVARPFEPFSRYLDQLRASLPEQSRRQAQIYMVPSGVLARYERTPSEKRFVLCHEGHLTIRTGTEVVAALESKRPPCSVCTGHQVLAGFNSINETHPYIAAQWHPEKNLPLEPSQVNAGSNKRIVWRCSQNHDFEVTVANRTKRGTNCAICSGKKLLTGTNDLATTHPEIAAQWHPTLNDGLLPHSVIAASGRSIYWMCEQGHTFKMPIAKRKAGRGCPKCSGRSVVPGETDLATTHPQIAQEWHPTANGDLRPQHCTAGSERLVMWLCPRSHTYEVTIYDRTGSTRAGCYYCSNRRLLPGFNDLKTRYPELSLDWDTPRNDGLTPDQTFPGNQKRWWTCRQGHTQHMQFRNRLRAGGCTQCSPAARVDT